MEEQPTLPDILKTLSDGYSKINNKKSYYWISLSIISILVFIFDASKKDIIFPFIEITIQNKYFFPLCFIIISLLIICYGSIHAQLIRTRALIQKYVDGLKEKFIGGIHLLDIWDSISESSVFRIAPLAQILIGKKQFFEEKVSNPINFRKIISLIYYIILRIFVLIIANLFPAFSLIISFINGMSSIKSLFPNIYLNIFWISIGIIALFVSIEMFILDIFYTFRAIKRIINRQSDNIQLKKTKKT